MTLSNALPVQFWTDPDESFNNKEVCGVERVSWCHPWNCDDEIKLQFPSNSAAIYSLNILDSEDTVLETIAFDQEATNPVNYLSGYPLSGYTNAGIDANTWTTGATPSVTMSGLFNSSDELVEAVTGIPAGAYVFTLNFNYSGADILLQVSFRKSGSTLDSVFYLIDANSTDVVDTIQLGQAPDQIIFRASTATVSTRTVTINSYSMVQASYINTLSFVPEDYCNQQIKLQIISDEEVPDVATSDCLSIKTNHSCTKLIEYSNSRDFAGLVYQDVSPEQTFYLRIPAIFPEHDDDNPAEQKDLELSNGEIVRLYNKLELKRRLKIGFVPQYLHQKIQLVLMHDNVTIDGKRWIRRDAYEKVEGHRTFPLRKANVNLHDKDFIKENQL